MLRRGKILYKELKALPKTYSNKLRQVLRFRDNSLIKDIDKRRRDVLDRLRELSLSCAQGRQTSKAVLIPSSRRAVQGLVRGDKKLLALLVCTAERNLAKPSLSQ
jgi:hypothetical protein